MGYEPPMGHWTADSLYEIGLRVRVVDIYKTYRDNKILGHLGEIIDYDFDGSNGWSYLVELDDPKASKLADRDHPTSRSDAMYGKEWFEEAELEPESGPLPDRLTEIRRKAWEEATSDKRRHYSDEQRSCYMAGMFTMWRLCGLENAPLFTFGPDGLPTELQNTTEQAPGNADET
ncbi:MAG: hypothetical protein AB7L09_03240 [Nitrospira sp.]